MQEQIYSFLFKVISHLLIYSTTTALGSEFQTLLAVRDLKTISIVQKCFDDPGRCSCCVVGSCFHGPRRPSSVFNLMAIFSQ